MHLAVVSDEQHTRLPACLPAPLSDAPLLITRSACLLCALSAADAICGWTAAEQEEWIEHPFGPAEFRHCIGAVDATYVRIQRPRRYEDERRLYSTYKKYHAVFFICIIDRHGKMLSRGGSAGERAGKQGLRAHHSPCLPPVCVGRVRYLDGGNQPKGCSEVAAFYKARRVFLRQPLRLLADVAYHTDERCLTGYVERDMALPAAERARRMAFNARLSSERQRVEHTFSRIKHTFRLLQSQWNMPLERLPSTIRAAALLANWLHRTRGLGRNNVETDSD